MRSVENTSQLWSMNIWFAENVNLMLYGYRRVWCHRILYHSRSQKTKDIHTRFSALNITPAFQISWSTTWLAKRWARVCLLGSAHSIMGASQRSHLRCFCGKNIKAEYYFELKILEHMDAAALMRFDFIGLESRGICNPATRYIEASRAAFESEVSWVLQLLLPSLQVKMEAQTTAAYRSDRPLWRLEPTDFWSTINCILWKYDLK